MEHVVFTGAGLLLLAAFLRSRPNCGQGCQTVAQHLTAHGIDSIIAGLFG
jgi:hypothetical protein